MNFNRAMKDVRDGYLVKRRGMQDVVGMMGTDPKKNYVGVFKNIDVEYAYKKYIITEEDLLATDWMDAEEDDLERDQEVGCG